MGKWAIALDTCLVMLRCLLLNCHICQDAYDQTINYQLWTPLTLLPSMRKRIISPPLLTFQCLTQMMIGHPLDLKIFDIEDSKSSDLDDCCHHIEKVSTSIQMFSIFITNLIITN
jgi:hypothetical protein